jgi:hypothetical protein
MAMEIADENQAFIFGLGRGGGESVRFQVDPASSTPFFRYMGLECRKIKTQ